MLASMGFGEILIVAVLAIIILGPDRGVRLFKEAGKYFAKIRREWNDIEDKVDSG